MFLVGFSSCVSSQNSGDREPQSVSAESIYDPIKVELLKIAAQKKILFLFDEDLSKSLILQKIDDSCLRLESFSWIKPFYRILEVLRDYPDLQNRIHLIQFKASDGKPEIEFERDSEKTVSLVIKFEKTIIQSQAQAFSDIPCNDKHPKFIGRNIQSTKFNFPEDHDLIRALKEQPVRQETPLFSFDPGFLSYLAERETILALTRELLSEKDVEYKPWLPLLMNGLAEDLTKAKDLEEVNFVFDKLKQNAFMRDLGLFKVRKDRQLAAGLEVGQSRDLSNIKVVNSPVEISSVFLTYISEGGNFKATNYSEVVKCLKGNKSKLSGLSEDSHRYLSPGFSCIGN